MKTALLWFALAVGLRAQGSTAFVPSYYVGTGVTYDYYGKTGFAASTEFAAKVSGTVYSYTTLELTASTATLRTGAAYLFSQTGLWSLLALGDAGLATGQGPTLGSFSGGGFVFYDIGSKVTKGVDHFYIGVGGRIISTGANPQPIFEVTFGKGF